MKNKKIGINISSTGKTKENIAKMNRDFKSAAMIIDEASMKSYETIKAFGEAAKKLGTIRCPKDMVSIGGDFNKVERIIIDSLTPINNFPTKFNNMFYDESGIISKRVYKKLMKELNPPEKKNYKQEQTDLWTNKWDKKIKKKL